MSLRAPSPSVYVIAEMACAHDGSIAHARRIAEAAAESGADALQLQIWRAADLMVPQHPAYPRLQSLEISRSDWAELVRDLRARYPRLDLQACIYDAPALEFVVDLGIDLVKIHANEIGNTALLRRAACVARRIDLCVGACGLDEIARAIATIDAVGSAEVWLLYGIQTYPTPVEQAHLAQLNKLALLFERPVGYQDHTDATQPGAFFLPAAAVGMGVRVLEKHITDDRSRQGADYQAALEPEEFTRFVKMVRDLERAQGVGTPRALDGVQAGYRAVGMRSLVASTDLPTGKALDETDLLALRSAEGGLEIGELPRVLGRKLRRPLAPFESLREEDLQ